jgi:hypothetical protein
MQSTTSRSLSLFDSTDQTLPEKDDRHGEKHMDARVWTLWWRFNLTFFPLLHNSYGVPAPSLGFMFDLGRSFTFGSNHIPTVISPGQFLHGSQKRPYLFSIMYCKDAFVNPL